MSLKPEQQSSIWMKKAKSIALDIQAIVETGRKVTEDRSKLTAFKGMFRTLESHYQRYNEIMDQLTVLHTVEADLPDFPNKDATEMNKAVKKYYFECYSIYETYNETAVPGVGPNGTAVLEQSLSARPAARAQLPKLNLHSFSGLKFTEWPLYRDTFKSLVHTEDSIPPIAKFHYLIGSLTEPALSVVKSIPLDANNYPQAWAAILRQYDNKRKLASNYIDRILSNKAAANKSNLQCVQHFLTNVAEHVTSLKNMAIPNAADYILFELAIRSVDSATREAFEIKHPDTVFPTFDDLMKFMQSRYQALLLVPENKPFEYTTQRPPNPSRYQPKPGASNNPKSSFFAREQTAKQKNYANTSKPIASKNSKNDSFHCFICSAQHSIPYCPTFIAATPFESLKLLKNFKGCLNCLHPHHVTKACTSKFACRVCKQRHYTDLHDALAVPNSNNATPLAANISRPQADTDSALALTALSSKNSEVILGTSQARIRDKNGVYHSFRLVVDSGSQLSFATKSLINRLGLPMQTFAKPIVGVGQSNLAPCEGKVNCIVTPMAASFPLINVSAIVVKQITSFLPQNPLPVSLWKKYATFELADPSFWNPGPIDMLLGADVFMEILLSAPITPFPNQPSILNTIFGHIIIGRFNVERDDHPLVSCFATASELHSVMQKFWELEEIPKAQNFTSASDAECERHFRETHHRLPNGRYEVALPFKGRSPPVLGNSRRPALTRLYNLEHKLHRNENLRTEYHTFLQEYLRLGHMEPAKRAGEYIIPHHGVFKTGTNSKIRVVFDASARTSGGSLNEKLHIGPKLQNSICLVLLNFRRHPIVFSADCVKMYRQILVKPTDRKYQHILWRFSPETPVQEFELTTVTYGMTCSSFLSHRVLQQLVEDEGAAYPRASRALLEDSYVDDLTTGDATLEEALILRDQLIELLARGGFALGKWCSNDSRILQNLSDTSDRPVNFLPDENLKILGCQWKPGGDVLSYNIIPYKPCMTKRSILSTIARTYDPLGYLAPVIFQAKVILQDTWNTELDWDDTVPPSIAENWYKFSTELPSISEIQIPRYLQVYNASQYDVVGFCDASERGYCACIYLRVGIDGTYQPFLLQAKTKLAPRKSILTIPRMELCGAYLLTQLFSSLAPFFKHFKINNHFFFTDSSIVLAWLKTSPDQLKIFAAHRVSFIMEVTKPSWWLHVRSEQNPADCGSRGLYPTQLKSNCLWWSGPDWLSTPEAEWPTSAFPVPQDPLPELKTTSISLLVTKHDFFVAFTSKFSSYQTLVNVIAYVFRFGNNSRADRTDRITGPITAEEFKHANLRCIYLLQQHFFSNSSDRKTCDLFANLNVFEDADGLLRVGGRLMLSNLAFPQRHPLLLPKTAHFTLLLVQWYHQLNLHAGSQALHAALLQRYWIPGAKILIRKVKIKCKRCLQYAKCHVNPYMGNLPATRFSTERAFFHTGVDFAGPLLCKESTRRNAPSRKSYVCVFICFSSKAIHLEVVPNLSTEGFLDALDRFVARRGIPAQIFSDCGSNFIGAARYLKEVEEWLQDPKTHASITAHCTPLAIQWMPKKLRWNFNPPYSPHFGGLWESGVKSFKTHLYKTLGNQPFTERELATIITKIEGILNSRPLFPSSSDPNDPVPLTPGHLLIGGPINSIPEPDYTQLPQNKLSRWQFLRQRTQAFWNCWKKDYLNTLQQRRKWTKSVPNLEVGDLVLLKKADCSPFQWPMGRIVKVHSGVDKVVRVVTIHTASGTYQRSTQDLIPLTPLIQSNDPGSHSPGA